MKTKIEMVKSPNRGNVESLGPLILVILPTWKESESFYLGFPVALGILKMVDKDRWPVSLDKNG